MYEHNASFCDFSYDLNGVLSDQSSYYIGNDFATNDRDLMWKAEEIS